jgi:predicted DNA-binding transcriptional regulator YafY
MFYIINLRGVIMVEYVLKNSLTQHNIITIMYQTKDNKISQRDIKVMKVEDNNIEAYCYLRHGIRRFRKENILAAVNH